MIYYLCDGKVCETCKSHNGDCMHTTRIEHAVNFKQLAENQWVEMPDEANNRILMLFSARKKLAEMYEKWRAKNNVLDCPLSVITFLVAHDLTNNKKCREFLEEQNND